MTATSRVTRPNNDLYSPSLDSVSADAIAARAQPWRPESRYWVAILCGPLVVTILAFLNSRRLGMAKGKQQFILVTGLLLTTATCAFIIWSMYALGLGRDDVRAKLLPRWTWQILSLFWAIVLVRLQTPAARQYQAMSDVGYASMWRAGLFWCLVSIVVYGVPVMTAAWYLGLFGNVRR